MPITLNDPLKLPCGVTLKNRLAKAAMTEGMADPHNHPTQRHETLYRRWASGHEGVGPGMLLTGNIQVDRRYLERPGNVAIEGEPSPDLMAKLKRWANVASVNDTAIWVQLSHAGRQTPKIVAKEPVGPSAIAVDLPGGQFGVPRALSDAEITDIIARFAHAARVVKSAGFDGVQVHGAHGYLISSFLNPLVNQRTDQWGGSLENRARLLLETVKAVRAKVGTGYPVSVKLNSSDFQKGGFSFEECLKVITMLNEVGIDLLEISGGSYEQPKMMDMEGMEPAQADQIPEQKEKRESTRRREAYFLDYAAAVTKIAAMPLMVTGGFRSVVGMNEALAAKAADVIGFARPLCVEPDSAGKLLRGEIDIAPSWEKTLAIGKGFWGPTSSSSLIRGLNGFGNMAFFYRNLYRLADGQSGKTKMNLLGAFLKHQISEGKMAKKLER